MMPRSYGTDTKTTKPSYLGDIVGGHDKFYII